MKAYESEAGPVDRGGPGDEVIEVCFRSQYEDALVWHNLRLGNESYSYIFIEFFIFFIFCQRSNFK